MKALLLNNVGKLQIVDKDLSSSKSDEVLIKIKACGICGSDIPRAYRDGAHNMPLIIGHEFSGEVVDSAENTENNSSDKINDQPYNNVKRVGIFPLIPCGKCPSCQKKKYEMCSNYSYLGSRRDGGFAEYVSVPKWNLIDLPENVTFEQAAMLEPMAVAVHAMRRVNPEPDDKVVVFGLGTIGMLLAMFLIERGIKNIFVIGNKDFQKKIALELGIKKENYCDSRESNVVDWIKEKTEQFGTDVCFECIGKNESVAASIDMMAPSGRVCMVGNPYSDMNLPKNTYWKILRNQLEVTGTWNSSFNHDNNDDWHYVLDKLARGKIHPENLITHKFDMEHIIEGFEIMRDKKEDYLKIMLVNEL